MKVLIKGAGDLATGIAYELWMAGHEILMTERKIPLSVRRMVSFSRAVYEGEAQVEQVKGVRAESLEEVRKVLAAGNIPIMVDEMAEIRKSYLPEVLVDAIMAKRNTGTSREDASLVIALGPGFCAGQDCHYVIETQRGAKLGEVISQGQAAPNTGIPGNMEGYSIERLIKASADGMMEPIVHIGDVVKKGQMVARTGGVPVHVRMSGMVRGMLQRGVPVTEGLKIGDVDARIVPENCYTISDKARRIGQGVLKAIESGTPVYKEGET